MSKLVKVNLSISTNQCKNGKIDTTSITTEELADEIIEKLESGDKDMHFGIFKHLYYAGYLEARVDKMYECEVDETIKEE